MVFQTIHLFIGLSMLIDPAPPAGDLDSPAERLLLAKQALEKERPNGPLVRLLLHQGLNQHERTLVVLVAQVDLLAHMADRNLIRLLPSQRARIRSLSERTDALIYRRSQAMQERLFREHAALVTELLSRGGGRPILRR
jgi:hypothetical protein